MGTWYEWLAERRQAATMTARSVPLKDVSGWGIQDDGARLGRPDNKFFNVIGVEITNAGREVQTWGQPMVAEIGRGAVVLIKAAGEERFLVAAKAEPGNTPKAGLMLLAPTLQTSASNLALAHGGKRPPRAELLDDGPVQWVESVQDGGRFFDKVNRYAVVPVDPARITPAENERWFTRDELREAYVAGELNEHLQQALLGAVL